MSAAILRPPERESRPGDYSETASKSTARTDHDHTYVTALHRRRAASWRIVDGDPWRYEPPVGGYGLAAAHLLELDVPGGVSGWILYSLQRSIINQENSLLLSAASGTDNATFNGWLNTSGTLTQNGSGLNGLDAIIQAAAAMRSSSSSFASPDLLITSPNTVAAILQEKDNQGRYLNDVIYSAGPGGFTWNGGPNESISPEMQKFGATPQGTEGGNLHLAGIPVVQTTQIDDYTAVMLSIRNGGGVFWVRQNMFVLYDPYTLASTNEYRYVAEERVALSVPRPAAVNLISDLAGTS